MNGVSRPFFNREYKSWPFRRHEMECDGIMQVNKGNDGQRRSQIKRIASPAGLRKPIGRFCDVRHSHIALSSGSSGNLFCPPADQHNANYDSEVTQRDSEADRFLEGKPAN